MSDRKIQSADIQSEAPVEYDGTLLFIDDDQEEIFVLQRALAKTPINLRLEVAQNGQDALDLLADRHERGKLEDIVVILLDLNMPRMNGHTFLKTVRQDERFSRMPVVVLTTAKNPETIKQAYSDGANAVISKADTMEEMMNIVDIVEQYWFQNARKYYLD